jgi:hypothetical protein
LLDAVNDVTNSICRTTSGNISLKEGAGTRGIRQLSFHWQPVGGPVSFATRVAEYLAEPKALKPPRGSRAHISLVIVAVSDHRAIFLKLRDAPPIERSKWYVDRSWQVFSLVLISGENLNKLRPVLNHAAHIVSMQFCWHSGNLL